MTRHVAVSPDFRYTEYEPVENYIIVMRQNYTNTPGKHMANYGLPGGVNVAVGAGFETLRLSRGAGANTQDTIRQLEKLVENSSIRIVDIRRTGSELVVTYRRLTG